MVFLDTVPLASFNELCFDTVPLASFNELCFDTVPLASFNELCFNTVPLASFDELCFDTVPPASFSELCLDTVPLPSFSELCFESSNELSFIAAKRKLPSLETVLPPRLASSTSDFLLSWDALFNGNSVEPAVGRLATRISRVRFLSRGGFCGSSR